MSLIAKQLRTLIEGRTSSSTTATNYWKLIIIKTDVMMQKQDMTVTDTLYVLMLQGL